MSVGIGEDVTSDGSGVGAAIEIGTNEVWETVFVGDETIRCGFFIL